MRFFLLLSALVSFSAFAQENAVRLNVGSLATGLAYVKENLDYKAGESQDTEKYHIAIGYLRHLGHKFQLVANASYKYDNVEAGDVEKENNELTFELGALYNFTQDLKSSFYVGALYYRSDRFQGEYNSTVDTESDGEVSGVELTIGKRFNLVENLSYVISLDYITGLAFGGDFKDVYDGGSITRLNLATFEYYF